MPAVEVIERKNVNKCEMCDCNITQTLLKLEET